MDDDASWLFLAFLVIALLYSSVGQAGASGYLAAMGFFQLSADAMKIVALSLNTLVAAIATLLFWRSGMLSWPTFYPFGVLGIPFSMVGGAMQLPSQVYFPVVGAILLFSALQMLHAGRKKALAATPPPATPPFVPGLLVGAAIGLLSGITGTGGGIFLAPIILAMNWVGIRQMAGVTAAYNLLNSAAALLGAHAILDATPPELPQWMIAVAIGGALGAGIGSRYLPETALRITLAVVLLVAGIKFIAS